MLEPCSNVGDLMSIRVSRFGVEIPEVLVKYLTSIMLLSFQAKKIIYWWSLGGFYSGFKLISVSVLQEISGDS